MSNRVLNSILEERIEVFKFAFQRTSKEIFLDEDSKKLIHPGEFGTFREMACKEYLRLVIPMSLEIGTGFLITDKGAVSTQCDLVIYDRNSTPLIQNTENQRFFPIETACAVGEVKSDLNKSQFVEAINKLARTKKLKEEISNPVPIKRQHQGAFDPTNYPYDHIFSILICNKLDFNYKNLVNEIDALYNEDIQPWQKHNIILSISDGLLAYYDENDKTMMYPYIGKICLKNRFVTAGSNKICHFHFASSYIFMGTTSASIYYPEISDYLKIESGNNFDQK